MLASLLPHPLPPGHEMTAMSSPGSRAARARGLRWTSKALVGWEGSGAFSAKAANDKGSVVQHLVPGMTPKPWTLSWALAALTPSTPAVGPSLMVELMWEPGWTLLHYPLTTVVQQGS